MVLKSFRLSFSVVQKLICYRRSIDYYFLSMNMFNISSKLMCDAESQAHTIRMRKLSSRRGKIVICALQGENEILLVKMM